MKKIALAAFIVTVVIALNANASRMVECSLKRTGGKIEDAVVDTLITTKVKTLFLKEPALSAMKLHVITKNQMVTLKGEVETEFEKNVAINLAESIEEVQNVQSKLKVCLG
ncbi:MAG: BON domain-containing protein [Candidatus Berkiella sp.]